jgi:hypothetical protein
MNGVEFDNGSANLCANCHHSRSDVREVTDNFDQGSRFSVHHGPQGDLIEGTGGYEYDGYNYQQSNHKGAVEDACIGCHMGNPQEHQGYRIGGHSFNMEDPETGYTLIGVCEDCHDGAEDEFDFLADSDYDHDGEIEGYQSEIEGLLDSLAVLLIAEGVMNSSHRPVSGIIPDGGVAGALYNYGIVEEDRSLGIHNFNYMQGLLQSSIEYLD